MIQWHPIFGEFLRPVLQGYYEVQTNVPVGDLPREADIILLRRASAGKPPFCGVWRHLTRWNVLELKGRSESARIADLDSLVEVGLGIHRRLQEKDRAADALARSDVSLWYLANHLGKRFLKGAVELLGELRATGPGMWHARLLGRPLWFVSNRDVPIDRESAPLHMVSDEPIDRIRELAQVVVAESDAWKRYVPWLGMVHPNLVKEIRVMATKRKKGDINWDVNIGKVIRQLEERELGLPKHIVDAIGVDRFLAALSPAQRREALRRLQAESQGEKAAPVS